MQYYVIKFVSDLQQVGGRWFSPSTPVSSTNENNRHDITEILLKVAFNTITILTQQNNTKWQIETLIQLPDSRYIIYATV
jgi:hypothetical protein